MADSSTGGYLAGTETAFNAEHFFHDLIMNLTGLNKTLVRPRWQPNAPVMPASNTDWCAFGVTELESDDTAYVDKNAVNTANLVRHERYSVLCSFYGSSARDYLRKMRDGLEIGQNREVLFLNNFGYVTCTPSTHAPELINDIWNDRYDIEFQFARMVTKSYTIKDIAYASVYPIIVNIGGVDVNTQTINVVSNS